MNRNSNRERRKFIKTALAVPLLNRLACSVPAKANESDVFLSLPDSLLPTLQMLYGKPAYALSESDVVTLKTPDIAENSAIVSIRVSGESNCTSSFVVFVANNRNPLVAICELAAGSDLPVSLRIKMDKSSDIYLVADTIYGLVAKRKTVKVSIGCGGA